MSNENPFPPPSMRPITEQEPASPEIEASLEKGPYRRFEQPNFSNSSFAEELSVAFSRLNSQSNKTDELWLDSVKAAFFSEFMETYNPITRSTIQLMEETHMQIASLRQRIIELQAR